MDTTLGLHIGQVVKSKAGRDRNRVFVILDIIDDSFVLVVDGDLRKLSSPKKKKIKHLIVYNTILEEIINMLKCNQKINDATVRKLLEPFLTDKR